MKWAVTRSCLLVLLCVVGCGRDEDAKEDLGYLPEFVYVPPRVRAARPGSITVDPASGLYAVRSELVVALETGRTRSDLEGDVAAAGLVARVVGEIPNFDIVQIEIDGQDTAVARASLESLPSVRAAMANGVQGPAREFDDPYLTDADEVNDWGLRAIQAADAWDRTLGERITVAVIDSGCDPAHPDLRDRYAFFYSFATQSEGQDLSFPEAARHGTHVAGTVAATAGNGRGSAGVAPAARILALQALYWQLDDEGERSNVVTASDLIAAINMAVGRGAHVVNMSLGPTYPPETQAALDDPARRASELRKILAARAAAMAVYEPVLEKAARRGVVLVVSAGNNGRPAAWSALPSSRWTISVGAVDADGEAATFSGPYATNYHEGSGPRTVDLCAPGKAIHSCQVGGSYESQMGTSMAAPHVAGAAALLKAIHPSAPFETVRDVLVETATPLSTRRDIGGRLNAAAAVEEMAGRRDGGQSSPRMRPEPTPGRPVLPPEVTWTAQPRTITVVFGLGWRPQCWLCQLVRFLVDLFLQQAVPVEGGRFDAYGRVIDYPRRVAMGPPPNLNGRDRLAYVWERRSALRSSNKGTLEAYVVREADQAVERARPGEGPGGRPGEGEVRKGEAPSPDAFVRDALVIFGEAPSGVDRQALLDLVREDRACVAGGVLLLGEDTKPHAQRVEEEHLALVRAYLAHEKPGLEAIYRLAPEGAAPSPFPQSLLPWVRAAMLAHAYVQHAVEGRGKAYELKARVLLERLWEHPRVYRMCKGPWPAILPSEAVAAKEATMGFDWESVR